MNQGGLLRIASLALVAWTTLAAVVLADDWVVDRLRGEAMVNVGGSWQPLRRGDVVSDESRIRSSAGSRVTFTRDAEAIELSGETEIRIFDREGERMTTVMQAYGTVTVEAERLQIQHFSIQTPYLAAIVKGTRFTVHSDDTQSSVEVSRGLVQVQDYVHGMATDITPGQSAVVSDEIALNVSGRGPHASLVTLDGEVVDAANRPANGQGGAGSNSGNAFGHDEGAGSSGKGLGNGDHRAGNAGNGNGNATSGNSGNGNAGSGNANPPSDNANGGSARNGNAGNGNAANGNAGNADPGSGNAANGNGASDDAGGGNPGNGNSGAGGKPGDS